MEGGQTGEEGVTSQGRGVEGVEGMEDVAVAEDSGGEGLGERKPVVGVRPQGPTKAEIEEHFPNHAHYRSWCADCRAGRSISRQHRKRSAGDEALGPTISLDYAFMHDGED